uniref:Uncharacterized protein n=1 Tax=Magallana gigas TaxID=29159 RepID=A0A8W8KSS9_MAGGI
MGILTSCACEIQRDYTDNPSCDAPGTSEVPRVKQNEGCFDNSVGIALRWRQSGRGYGGGYSGYGGSGGKGYGKGKGNGYSTVIYYPVAQDYPVPVPVDAFGGFGGGYGGGFGGGLPYGGLGLALNSVQNQNQMGLFGGAGGQSTLGGAFGLALTASNPLLGGLITAGSGFPGLGLVGALG